MPDMGTSSAEDRAGQSAEPAVDLKGSVFTLPVLRLASDDLATIEHDLSQRLAKGLRFFEHAPVVIDLEPVRDSGAIEFAALASLLRGLNLVPVGVRHGSAAQNDAAVAAGLAILKGGPSQNIADEGGRQGAQKTSTNRNTRIVDQPVRSGQQIYAAGDLVVLAPVNAGAEIIADGHIHIYAPLRGRALAGVKGDTAARIFVHSLEAELIAVAGNFRIFEDQVPDELRGKPVQIYLDGEQLIVRPLGT